MQKMLESNEKESERTSLQCALASGVAIALMTYLVQAHDPGDDLRVAAQFPVLKVMACMLIAGASAAMSLLLAVRPAFQARWFSLIWIIPLAAGWIWFMNWYDWAGLISQGKAWPQH